MLRLQNISKSFAGVKALQDVSIEFKAGEVHALCGENGAGKSTLMNIIMGNLQPDNGTISWLNKSVTVANVLTARDLGISIVYQERSLANALTIAENIFPVQMPLNAAGLIDYPLLYSKTQSLLNELGLKDLSPKTLVSTLSVARMQMVEIAKAIAANPRLLILDEPTASITHSETEILFNIISRLKEKGTGFIYISHRMHEIRLISDKISVLKDGRFMGTVDKATSTKQLISLMVGREIESLSHETYASNDIKLEAQNITGKGFFDISFKLHEGEILGFAGLEGSGKSAIAKAIFGYESLNGGKLLVDGTEYKFRLPSQAMKKNIVYLPEERKSDGLFMEKSVAENIVAAQLDHGFYDEAAVNKESKKLCAEFGVRTATVTQAIATLSGGNQQKIMLLRCLALHPEILIINEPTQGVDAGSKAEIYEILKKLTSDGKSILLISGDLSELLFLSDRILVMHEGRTQGILTRQEATEEKITSLASGVVI